MDRKLYFLSLICVITVRTQEIQTYKVKKDYTGLCAAVCNKPEKILYEKMRWLKELNRDDSRVTLSQFIQKTDDLMVQNPSPISWLTECSDPGCNLNRLSWPYRTSYETKVLSLLQKQYTNNKENLTYISVGSGSMFQDLVSIIQFLSWRKKESASKRYNMKDITTLPGILRFDIHLINSSYEQVDEFITKIQETRVREKRKLLRDVAEIDSREYLVYVQQITALYRYHKDFSTIQKGCYMRLVHALRGHQQFSRIIKDHFTDVDVEIILHASMAKFSTVYGNDIPDVIAAADLKSRDAECVCSDADQKSCEIHKLGAHHEEYVAFVAEFCSRAQRGKRYPVLNACLSKLDAKLNYDNKAHLLSVSSEKKAEDYHPHSYKNLQGNEQIAYIHDAVLQ